MQILQYIEKSIKLGESETTEFKLSFNDEALESIGAFANARGGTLFVGISNDSNVIGIDIGKKTIEDIANRIQESTEPRIQPSISITNYSDKAIIIIDVKPIVIGPISVRGRYFRRVGKTNQRMSHDEIMQRMRSNNAASWDSCIETNTSLDELNQKSISVFVNMVRKVGRQPVPDNVSDLDFLRKIKLIVDDKPTRAS